MKFKALIFVALAGVACLFANPSRLVAQEAPQAEAAQEEHDALEESMEALEDHMRILRKSLKDESKREASLEAVVGMQEAVGRAKLTTPPMAAELEGDKRSAFLLAYRLKFISMDRDLLSLEELVLKGETEKARAMFKTVRGHEDSGHEDFTDE